MEDLVTGLVLLTLADDAGLFLLTLAILILTDATLIDVLLEVLVLPAGLVLLDLTSTLILVLMLLCSMK